MDTCGALRGVGVGAAGVSWNQQEKRWRATLNVICGGGTVEKRHLGAFEKEVDAALAYDQAAREYHGDASKLNFPHLPPQPQMVLSKPQPLATSQYRGECEWTCSLGLLASATHNDNTLPS
jgi:hypothetical protein